GTGLHPKPRHIGSGGSRRRGLGELIDPLLEELLIGPQIRQLVSSSRGGARDQRDGGDGPADRRYAEVTPIAGHRSSLFKSAGYPKCGAPFCEAMILNRGERSSALYCPRGVFIAA